VGAAINWVCLVTKEGVLSFFNFQTVFAAVGFDEEGEGEETINKSSGEQEFRSSLQDPRILWRDVRGGGEVNRFNWVCLVTD